MKMKFKYIGLIIAFFMIINILLSPFNVSVASDLSENYTIKLNIKINKKGESGLSSEREVRYRKLSEDDIVDNNYFKTSQKYNFMSTNEIIKELGEGQLSEKSTPPISADDGYEHIEITGLKAGTYLIKETDDSIKRNSGENSTKIATVVEKVPTKEMVDNVLIINAKETPKEPIPSTEIKLIKIDKNDHDKFIDMAQFELWRRDKNPEYETNKLQELYIYTKVAVKGNNGVYSFDILNKDASNSPLLVTKNNGEIIVRDLPEGEYFFKEVIPTPEYDNDLNRNKETDIVKLGEKVIIENELIPTLIKHEDGSKKPLSGAVFEVYNSKGDKLSFRKLENGSYSYDNNGDIKEVITDSNGYIYLKDMPQGKGYYFIETKAPYGYIKSDKKFVFDIDNNGKVVGICGRVEVANIPIEKTPPSETTGGYNFIKVDDTKSKNRLSGAKFEVLRVTEGGYESVIVDGKRLVVESNSNGEFKVENLPFGDYVLREITAPTGYIPDVKPIEFKVTEVSFSRSPIFIENTKNPDKPPKETTPPPTTPNRPPTNTTVPPKTPKTTYVPNDNPGISRGPMVKTGDVRIVIAAIIGMVMMLIGIRLVYKSEKEQIKKISK